MPLRVVSEGERHHSPKRRPQLTVNVRSFCYVLQDFTGAAMTMRGMYIPPGRKPRPGEQKLKIMIEANTQISVLKAKAELKRVLEETTLQCGFNEREMKKFSIV